MRGVITRLAPAALLIAIVACSNDEYAVPEPAPQDAPDTVAGAGLRDTSETPNSPDPALPDSAKRRPQTLQDTLMIEGMPEVTTASLVRAPDHVDPPFSTYLPERMNVVFPRDSAAVRFVAAFGGAPEPQAYLQVVMHAAGTDEAWARTLIAQFLDGKTVRAVDAPQWALGAHGFDYRGAGGRSYTGRITLARHGARYFQVLQHYPPEFGDGLGPRFHSILAHWRWEDTGQPLTGAR